MPKIIKYPSLPLAVVVFLLLMIFAFGFNNTANAETLGPNTNLTLKENVTVWIVSPGNTTTIFETFSNGTTTYFGNNVIFTVPVGPHTVTVFDGYQSDNHFSIYQKDSVSFAVALSTPTPNPTPTPTVPEFPITASLVTVLAAVSLLQVIDKRKLITIKN